MTLDDLNARFYWTADGLIDSWHVMWGLDAHGRLRGDCDDYAMTVLRRVVAKSAWRFWWLLLTMQAMPWFTRLPNGEWHVMLWVRRLGWIDNTNPYWGLRKMPLYFPFVLPVAVLKLGLGVVFGRRV